MGGCGEDCSDADARRASTSEGVVVATKTLVPKLRSRERIESYGGSGVGKSTILLSIAAKIPTATFHVLDIDDSYERLTECWEDESVDFSHVKYKTGIGEWEEFVARLEEVCPLKGEVKATEDDWLGVDLVSIPWEWARDYYTEQIFGKTTAEHFMTKRQQLEERREKAKKDSGGGLGLFEQNTDWPTIKALFSDEVHKRLLRWPGHIYLAAEEQKVGSGDDKETKQAFSHVGLKPRGHSRTPHLMQSVFYLRKPRTSTWVITSVKDRGRRLFDEEEFEDFGEEYLKRVAGWKVGVAK